LELARHYGTAVLPTRVNHPKDKAKVEKGVQTVEYWLIAALRKRQFFSIAEINEALWERLEDLNARPMQHNAYRLELKGESMRKLKSSLTHSGHLEV